MEYFWAPIATFVNNMQQANSRPAPNASTRPPQLTPSATIDFSGANTGKKRTIDSLGGGRII